jgi:hypothetical protein
MIWAGSQPAQRLRTGGRIGRTLGRVAELAVCPECGAERLVHRAVSMPIGRVVGLVGGLALVAAYFMPWFGSQGVILTGAFLDQLLGSTSDLRRLLPGAAGGPLEVQLLRALVDFFPLAGGLAAVVSLGVSLQRRWRLAANVVIGACGALALIALAGGVSRLPPGATWEVGLWLIGAGALAILAGVGLDVAPAL